MARKKKTKEDGVSEVEKDIEESNEVEKEIEESNEVENVAPLEYPKAEEPSNPYLLKWKEAILDDAASGYIRGSLAHWLYSELGIDKRPGQVSQEDFEKAMANPRFSRKMGNHLK